MSGCWLIAKWSPFCDGVWMDKKFTDALAQQDLVIWTRNGKHYAVIGHKGHFAGVEHHISDRELEELKTLGAKVEHAPHQVNG